MKDHVGGRRLGFALGALIVLVILLCKMTDAGTALNETADYQTRINDDQTNIDKVAIDHSDMTEPLQAKNTPKVIDAETDTAQIDSSETKTSEIDTAELDTPKTDIMGTDDVAPLDETGITAETVMPDIADITEINTTETNTAEINNTEDNNTEPPIDIPEEPTLNITEDNITEPDIPEDPPLNITDINTTETNISETNITDNITEDNMTDNSTEQPDTAMNETIPLPPVPITTGTGQTTYVIVNGKMIASKSSAGTTYYTNDAVGSVRMTFNAAGILTSKSSFYPYGKTVSKESSSSGSTVYGFTGKENDGRLIYFGARYYSPTTGKFLSIDPIYQPDISTSAYARGNPLSYNDPDGRKEHPLKNAAAMSNNDQNIVKWYLTLLDSESYGIRHTGQGMLFDPFTSSSFYSLSNRRGISTYAKGVGFIAILDNVAFFANNVQQRGHIYSSSEELSMAAQDNRMRNSFIEKQGLNPSENLALRRSMGESGLPAKYDQNRPYAASGMEVAYLALSINNRNDFLQFMDHFGGNRFQTVTDSAGNPTRVVVGDNGDAYPIPTDAFNIYTQKLNWLEDKNWRMPINPEFRAAPEQNTNQNMNYWTAGPDTSFAPADTTEAH